MKIVALVELPTYGEAGAYLDATGSDDSSCYLSNDLHLMGGTSLLVPGLDDVWPWYIAARPTGLVPSDWNTCNIYLLPQEVASWCEEITAVDDNIAGPYGGILHLRALADLLESCPEFDLGDPVLVDQSWPR